MKHPPNNKRRETYRALRNAGADIHTAIKARDWIKKDLKIIFFTLANIRFKKTSILKVFNPPEKKKEK